MASKRVRVRVMLVVPVYCDVSCTWDPEEETSEIHKISIAMAGQPTPETRALHDEEYAAIDKAAQKEADGG